MSTREDGAMRYAELTDPDAARPRFVRVGRRHEADTERCACGELATDQDAHGPCCEDCHGLSYCPWCGARGRELVARGDERVCALCATEAA